MPQGARGMRTVLWGRSAGCEPPWTSDGRPGRHSPPAGGPSASRRPAVRVKHLPLGPGLGSRDAGERGASAA